MVACARAVNGCQCMQFAMDRLLQLMNPRYGQRAHGELRSQLQEATDMSNSFNWTVGQSTFRKWPHEPVYAGLTRRYYRVRVLRPEGLLV